MRQYIQFKDIPVTGIFTLNGNTWFKRSTRTAHIVKPIEYKGTWFYFGQCELCTVGRHSVVGL